MAPPIPADESPVLFPEAMPYAEFAKRVQETCLIGDPWYDGHPIFFTSPLVLPEPFLERVYTAGARVGRLFDELCSVVKKDPDVLDTFYRLPPFYKLMWLASEGFWHGFARMDMFLTDDGTLKIAELNADTPSGQVEALVPAWVLREACAELVDVNADYEERFWRLCLDVHRARTGAEGPPKRALILYPTDLSEDITLIRLYQRWFEERGLEVELGAPYNLQRTEEGGIAVFGKKIDLVLRHYKTDWWGERPQIFEGEDPVLDPEPLSKELFFLLDAERNGKVSVVNPFGALIPQNKRSMAFMWEEMARFSEEGQQAIRDLVPETYRLESQDRERLKREKDQWVLKSDFGCEGDEVLVGPYTDQETWDWCIDHALEGIWVVQRFFHILPFEDRWLPNYGVFLIAGAPAGLLVRFAPKSVTTGHDALVVSAFTKRS